MLQGNIDKINRAKQSIEEHAEWWDKCCYEYISKSRQLQGILTEQYQSLGHRIIVLYKYGELNTAPRQCVEMIAEYHNSTDKDEQDYLLFALGRLFYKWYTNN